MHTRNGSWITKVRASSRSVSKIRRIYCGCAGCGQIFRSFSGNVEKGPQLRSRAFGVLTYSVYAPRAKTPAALLDGLFEHSPFSLNRHHYSPQTIETSDSNQHPLATIPNLGQAPGRTWHNKKMSHHHRGDHDFFYFTMHTNILHVCLAPNCCFQVQKFEAHDSLRTAQY